MKNRNIDGVLSEITATYLRQDGNIPWIVSYSGGKDSTAMLILVWKALVALPKDQRLRAVYVVTNDTLVENPVVAHYVQCALRNIATEAAKSDLPITTHYTKPDLKNDFLVKVIGRGYPVPNYRFRWCVDRLKISPTMQFIKSTVDSNGAVVCLIGARKSESAHRAQTMGKHGSDAQLLSKHPKCAKAFVFAPLRNLSLEEVWFVINAYKAPWDPTNKLFEIYRDASADDYECPTVSSAGKGTCGSSRFGCWCCTVVKRDKSLSAQIDNGQDWLIPLLKLRDSMVTDRDVEAYRTDTFRNGKSAVINGRNRGYYTLEYRKKLLSDVIAADIKMKELNPNVAPLLTHERQALIAKLWQADQEPTQPATTI